MTSSGSTSHSAVLLFLLGGGATRRHEVGLERQHHVLKKKASPCRYHCGELAVGTIGT